MYLLKRVENKQAKFIQKIEATNIDKKLSITETDDKKLAAIFFEWVQAAQKAREIKKHNDVEYQPYEYHSISTNFYID